MKIEVGKNDLITLVGALMVAFGAYMPLISLAGIGSVSYADATEPEIYLLVALALGAAACGFIGKPRFALFAAIGAWLVLLWPVLRNLGGGDDGLLDQVADAVSDPLQKVAEDIFSNVVELDLEPGGYVFLAGMVIMLVGAAMNSRAVK